MRRVWVVLAAVVLLAMVAFGQDLVRPDATVGAAVYTLWEGQPRYFELNDMPVGEVILDPVTNVVGDPVDLGVAYRVELLANGDGVEFRFEQFRTGRGIARWDLIIDDYGTADEVIVNWWAR